MARLSDVPIVLRRIGPWGLVKRVLQQTDEDSLLVWASALAYSWLFAIFPFLIFLLSLLPYLPREFIDKTRTEIRDLVYQTIAAPQAADTIWSNVNNILSKPRGGMLGIGLLVALWGASGGVNMTISAIERCYELTTSRPLYIQRPKAVFLTIVVAVLVVTVLLLLPVGTFALSWIERHGLMYGHQVVFWIWSMVRYPIAVFLLFAILNVLYHFGPSLRQRYTFFTPGAVFCVVVWMGLGLLFRLYIQKFGKFDETYGTVGGVAILLLLFYIDAVVLLLGAEINSEIDFEVLGVPRGSKDFTRPQEPSATHV